MAAPTFHAQKVRTGKEVYLQGNIMVLNLDSICNRLKGNLTAEEYSRLLKEASVTAAPKNTVFVFPGNSGHHDKGVTPDSFKTGHGLAKLAQGIHNECEGKTLSLPNTNLNGEIGDCSYPLYCLMLQPKHPKGAGESTNLLQEDRSLNFQNHIDVLALKQLFAAYFLELIICIPGRTHNTSRYFSGTLNLDENTNLEPAFGGDNNKNHILELHDFYLQYLNVMLSIAKDCKDLSTLTKEILSSHLDKNGIDINMRAVIIEVFNQVKEAKETHPGDFNYWFNTYAQAPNNIPTPECCGGCCCIT